jgi:hypothetical protein
LWSISWSQPTNGQPSANQAATTGDSRVAALEAKIVGRDRRIADLERGLIEALARAEQRAEIAEGRIDELLAIVAAPGSSQAAGSRDSDAEAAAPKVPIAADQKRAGPFWRSCWDSWLRRHP